VTRFVFSEGAFFLLAGKSRSDWALNALAAGAAKVRIGEESYQASAERSTEVEKERVLGLFSKKYGRRLTEEWYSKAELCLKLTPSSPPTRRGGASGETDVKTTLDEWRSKNGDYYLGVAQAFDSASEEYDFTIGSNFINSWIRERSIEELLTLTKRDDVLLEIGCGTGSEAIEVSKRVAGVLATDISSEMISLLRRKIEARNLLGRVSAFQVGASEISLAAPLLPGGKTRVAYSFNGALNCEPNIERVPSELSKVVEDGGYFVCSIRNSLCISEALAHGMVLQFDKMAPRKKQPIMVSVGGMDIPSYYYRPSAFARHFSSRFRVRRMIGLPAILPPAYLSDIYFRARRVLSFIERVEAATAGSFPFNRFGDQTLIVMQKK
jgi:ubiquinone/menaquinone biosynthesis C-methylase UbiE